MRKRKLTGNPFWPVKRIERPTSVSPKEEKQHQGKNESTKAKETGGKA